MNSIPDRYAVFGNPIAHSKSPALQMAFAQQTAENIIYTAECIETENFSVSTNQFFADGGKGLNITVPFKIEAFNYADTLTERAKLAGAVNTLIKKNGTIIGDNTDGVGLVDDLINNLQWILKNKRVLILGAGGAVRGIVHPLLEANVSEITIANRTVEKAKTIARLFSKDYSVNACHYSDLSEVFDIVINGTSASLHGELPAVDKSVIGTQTCCYDMMYGKEDTIFMGWAKSCGSQKIADGLGMLVCQGAESFYQWRGIKPKTRDVIQRLRASL